MDISVQNAAIAVLGVIISAFVSKRTAEKTAKITTEAEIKRLEMEFAYQDKIRQETKLDISDREKQEAYSKMFSAVSAYRDFHNANYKSAAESSILSIPLSEDAKLNRLTDELLDTVRYSNPFTGPDPQTLNNLLDAIRTRRR